MPISLNFMVESCQPSDTLSSVSGLVHFDNRYRNDKIKRVQTTLSMSSCFHTLLERRNRLQRSLQRAMNARDGEFLRHIDRRSTLKFAIAASVVHTSGVAPQTACNKLPESIRSLNHACVRSIAVLHIFLAVITHQFKSNLLDFFRNTNLQVNSGYTANLIIQSCDITVASCFHLSDF